jgi:hypothetical protein
MPTYCAMAKRFATDAGFTVCNEALQLHGGYGYIREYPLERLLRDAACTRFWKARTKSCASSLPGACSKAMHRTRFARLLIAACALPAGVSSLFDLIKTTTMPTRPVSD